MDACSPLAIAACQNRAAIPLKLMRFTGAGTDLVSSPTPAKPSGTTFTCIIDSLKCPDWTPATTQYLAGQWSTTGANRSWVWQIDGGTQKWAVYETVDGTTVVTSVPLTLPGFTDGTTHTVGIEVELNNASNRLLRVYEYVAGSWGSAIATDSDADDIAGVINGNANFAIGGFHTTGGQVANLTTMARVRLYNGLQISVGGGTLIADCNAQDYVSGTTFVDASLGHTWTLGGSVTIS